MIMVCRKKNRKGGREYSGKKGILILTRVTREGLTEKLMFKKRSEGGEGVEDFQIAE